MGSLLCSCIHDTRPRMDLNVIRIKKAYPNCKIYCSSNGYHDVFYVEDSSGALFEVSLHNDAVNTDFIMVRQFVEIK